MEITIIFFCLSGNLPVHGAATSLVPSIQDTFWFISFSDFVFRHCARIFRVAASTTLPGV